MKRVFGKGKEKTPAPTLDETTTKLGERGDQIDKKIKDLDTKLLEYKRQLKAAKSPAAKQSIQQKALHLVKQKKMYEGQREQLYGQQFNVDQVAFTAQSMKDTVDTVKALQDTSKTIKKNMKVNKGQLDISKIDSLMDELSDLQDMHSEVQEALGYNYSTPEIDEDDLLAELDLLEEGMADEVNDEGVPSYLEEPDLPTAPTEEPAQQAAAGAPPQPIAERN